MTPTKTPLMDTSARPPRPVVLGYTVLCGLSLGLLVFVEYQQRQAPIFLVLMMTLGTLGILTGTRLAPILILLFIAFCHLARQQGVVGRFDVERGPAHSTPNVLLCIAVLGYIAGHYRLQGLNRYEIPPRDAEDSKQPRAMASTAEIVWLTVSLPLWALAAQFAWNWLTEPRNILEWPLWAQRFTLFMLMFVPGLTAVAMLLRQVRRRRQRLDEATLLLQDTLWNETRGEQRWLTRWLAQISLKRKG